jgi:hypothetical protein
MQRKSVDLPAPLGPTRAVTVPRSSENDTSSNARTPGYSKRSPETFAMGFAGMGEAEKAAELNNGSPGEGDESIVRRRS